MEQMYKLALDPRVYPTDRLLAVMQGRDRSLPMAVAMAAKQKRDQMQVANKGAEAQREARQPTVLEKLVAQSMAPENTGIGALPAQNMEGIEEQSLAGGGIIAFSGKDNKQLVPGFSEDFLNLPKSTFAGSRDETDQERMMREYYERQANADLRTPFQQFRDYVGKVQAATTPRVNTYSGLSTPVSSPVKVAPQTPEQLSELEREKTRGVRKPLVNIPSAVDTKANTGTNVTPAAAVAAAAADRGSPSLADAYKSFADLTKQDNEDYLAKLAGRADKTREGLARLKRETGGEALMALGQAFLSNPNISRALSAGIPGVISAASSARKEGREISRLADDLDLNLAKARTAAKQGDRDSQLKFMELANIDRYRMLTAQNQQRELGLLGAKLNQLPESVRAAQYFAKNPGDYAYSSPSLGKQERISMDNASKQWLDAQSDISKRNALERQGVYSASDLYRLLNMGSIQSATIPGQGAPVIGKL